MPAAAFLRRPTSLDFLLTSRAHCSVSSHLSVVTQDIALFWFESKDDVPPYSVHAVVVCNDRMKGKMEYHELDNAGETTIVRNTVGLQRVPWPKLCAEQQRWDAFTKDEAISCKIDKAAMQFPVHGVGSEKNRRIFIVSSSFIEYVGRRATVAVSLPVT